MGGLSSRLSRLAGDDGDVDGREDVQDNQFDRNLQNIVNNRRSRGVKRSRDSEYDARESEDLDIDKLMNTPKKKKLFTTSEYIYR